MDLSNKKLPPTLLVCMQKRYAPNPECCANNGSLEILMELQQKSKLMNVDIHVMKSSCMMMCEIGPNIRLTTNGKVWNKVTSQMIEVILEECKQR
ncbi:(2Fe-2S) ferredoxin domain-containing protein [Methylotenera versatilis]|uniref:(2Fe-2S) ferredoxin domain-containing protein n=1 Tax=Methylotenera versatilis TaxID=1055487 RepID=UPI000647BA35|nr:(2Fe-2S) ferredoxin domain-containing protein [Methylotenera versatilis]